MIIEECTGNTIISHFEDIDITGACWKISYFGRGKIIRIPVDPDA